MCASRQADVLKASCRSANVCSLSFKANPGNNICLYVPKCSLHFSIQDLLVIDICESSVGNSIVNCGVCVHIVVAIYCVVC